MLFCQTKKFHLLGLDVGDLEIELFEVSVESQCPINFLVLHLFSDDEVGQKYQWQKTVGGGFAY